MCFDVDRPVQYTFFFFLFTAHEHYCIWYCLLLAKFVRDQLFSDFVCSSFHSLASFFFLHRFFSILLLWKRVLSKATITMCTHTKSIAIFIRYSTLHIQPTASSSYFYKLLLFIQTQRWNRTKSFWLDNNKSRCWFYFTLFAAFCLSDK